MTSLNKPQMLTAAAAFGAAGLFTMLSFSGTAEAASLFRCEGTTAKSVVSCCHEMTRDQRPLWMVRSGKNCEQVVVCRAKKSKATYSTAAVAAPKVQCFVKLAFENPNEGGNPGDGSGTRKRGGGGGQNSTSSAPN